MRVRQVGREVVRSCVECIVQNGNEEFGVFYHNGWLTSLPTVIALVLGTELGLQYTSTKLQNFKTSKLGSLVGSL
jgi:hypothetical protein